MPSFFISFDNQIIIIILIHNNNYLLFGII